MVAADGLRGVNIAGASNDLARAFPSGISSMFAICQYDSCSISGRTNISRDSAGNVASDFSIRSFLSASNSAVLGVGGLPVDAVFRLVEIGLVAYQPASEIICRVQVSLTSPSQELFIP